MLNSTRSDRPGCARLGRLSLLLICLAAAGAALGAETPEQLVVRVRIEGNKKISTKTILSYLRLRRSYEYDPEVLNADIRRLWKLESIEHVEADVTRVAGGVEVTFRIVEKRQIDGTKIEGNHKVWKWSIRDHISHPSKGYLKPYIAKQDAESILSLYHERGFLFARVDTEVREEKGKTYLIYRISEGPRSAVTAFEFKGNHFFSDSRLRCRIDSSRKRWPSIFFRGRFERETFQQDIEKITEYYRKNGFLDVIVGGYTRFSGDLKSITLVYMVYEGRRYRTESITFKGNTLFADDELARAIPLKPTRIFSPQKLLKSRLQIGALYSEIGHLDVDPYINSRGITADTVYDTERATVKLTFNIHEGPRVLVREVQITGNTKTKQNVIRRQLELYPGEAVNLKRVRESEQRLMNTGYFDSEMGRGIEVTFEPEGAAVRDAIVKVREGRTGSFSFGVGYSTTASVIGDVSFSDRNFDIFDWPKDWEDLASGNAFRGAGQVLTIRAQPGLKYQTYSISLDNPSVWDTPFSAGVSARLATRVYDWYNDNRLGPQVRGGWQYAKFQTLRALIGYDYVTINSVPRDAPSIYQTSRGYWNRPYAGIGWSFDKLDSTFLPSKGYTIDTDVTATFTDVETLTWSGTAARYWTVFEPEGWGKHILMLRSSAAVVTDYAGTGVPIFERQFLGGTQNMRGFAWQGVSPVDPKTEVQVGGRSRFIGTAEYSIPVVKDYIRMHTFVDAGWVGTTEADVYAAYADVRVVPGIGWRVRLPMLGRAIIGIDLGWPVVSKPYDDTQMFQFFISGLATW